VSHCLYLCGETWRRGDRGATNDMIVRSLERQCGAAAARAAERGDLGRTQLMRAALAHDLPRVLQLVQLGAPLGPRDGHGSSALLHACYGRDEPVARALLDGKYEGRGAEADAADANGWTPLMWAVFWGREGLARLLLARGAKAGTRSKEGFTALSIASRHGHDACAALLRARGAKS